MVASHSLSGKPATHRPTALLAAARPLWRARLAALRNRLRRADRTQRVRLGIALALATGACTLAHLGTIEMLEFVASRTVLAPSLAHKLVEMMFLMQVLLLTFSGLLMAMSHLFKSDDIIHLAVTPLPDSALFVLKWIDVTMAAAWMPILFSLAVLTGVGRFMGAQASFYALAPLALFGCALVPAAFGLALACTLGSIASVNRSRHILAFLSTVVVALIGVAVWRIDPQGLAEPERLRTFADAIAHFDLPMSRYLPSWAATRMVLPSLHGSTPSAAAAGTLLAWTVTAGVGGGAIFLLTFRRGLSLSLAARRRPRIGPARPGRVLAAMTRGMPRAEAAIAHKDVLGIVRDPTQWSQLLFLVALMVVYLLSIAAIPLDSLPGLKLPRQRVANFLAYSNLLLSGLVLSAIALRLLFTSFSLEGRAFWILRASPIDRNDILRAKFRTGWPVLATVGLVLAVGAAVLLEAATIVIAMLIVAVFMVAIGLSGMAVGLGAWFPNFRARTPMTVSSGFGGLLYTLCGIAYVLVVVTLLGIPGAVVRAWVESGTIGIVPGIVAAVLFSLAIVVTWAACFIPLRLGGRD